MNIKDDDEEIAISKPQPERKSKAATPKNEPKAATQASPKVKKDARPRKDKDLTPSLFYSTECLKLTSRYDFIDAKPKSISVTKQRYFIETIITIGLLFNFPIFTSFTTKKKMVLKT